jgi:hypothetical protein
LLTFEINGEGGFPHSEIVGSMLAHSSPTLIAACHVLHRLYMPRHPRIALTSRLRVRTTNDNAGLIPRRKQPKLGRAAKSRYLGADDYNLSQIIVMIFVMDEAIHARQFAHHIKRRTNRRSNPLSSKTHTATASILRTHSQCQRGASRSKSPHFRAANCCLHLWKYA